MLLIILRYNEDESDEQWLLGKEMLEKRGFLKYEVSNFAQKGHESKHNCTYWHLEDYLGCGSGATGSLYENSLRWTNTNDIMQYISYWTASDKKFLLQTIPRENEVLSMEIQEEEFLMMGFRLLSGVSAERYKRRFSKDLGTRLGTKDGVFSKWQSRGDAKMYIKENEHFYALTEKGILFLNTFLEEIL